MKKRKNNDVATGRGWVGRLIGGEIGWMMPDHLTPYGEPPTDRIATDETLERCEITVRVLKDKCGRPIRRRVRPSPNGRRGAGQVPVYVTVRKKKRGHDFAWALRMMKRGSLVKRPGFQISWDFTYLTCIGQLMSIEHILATDWELER